MIIQISLDDVVNTLNRWRNDLGLDFHGQKDNKAAAWSAGNCLITAYRLSNTNTEIELMRFRREWPDDKASQAWNLLGYKLTEAHWATKFIPVQPDPLWESTLNIAGEMTQDWQQTETEWKSKRRDELKNLMPNADEGNIEGRLEMEWQGHVQMIEWLRTEYQERQSVTNKTAAEAAEDFFVSLQNTHETKQKEPSEQVSNPQPRKRGKSKLDEDAIKDRRKEVKRLKESDRTDEEIAAELNVSVKTIQRDKKALGL